MKVFRFYCRYWAAIGGLLFVLLAFFVGLMPAFPFASVVMILLPILTCRSRNTTFGFARYQAEEFDVKHGIATLWRKQS